MGVDLGSGKKSVAARIAYFLKARGVSRVFGLQGGHIQPIWDWLGMLDVPIVDVRDEGAAVHMAHAYGELTGELGIAMATAGPGVTTHHARKSIWARFRTSPMSTSWHR